MAAKRTLTTMRDYPGGWVLMLVIATALAMTAAGEGWIVSLVLLALILSVPLAKAADGAKQRFRVPRAVTLTVIPVGLVLVVLASLALGGLQIADSIAEQLEREEALVRLPARARPVPSASDTRASLTSAPITDEAEPPRLADKIATILYRDWMANMVDRRALGDAVDDALKAGTAFIGQLLSQLMTGLSGFVTGLGVLLVSTLIAAKPKAYYGIFIALFPPTLRPRVEPVAREVGVRMGRWAVARVISAAALAVMTAVGLHLCGVRFALGLGLITGLTSFIPIIGTVLGGLVAFLTVLVTREGSWLGVLIVFVIANIVETYVLLPVLLKRAANIPPGLTIGSLLVMGTVGGLPGMLVASPLVLIITTVAETSADASE